MVLQLYTTVPQVLLPVIPHLTSELHSEDGAKRQEAATLLGRLLSLPGNKLVNEYRDVLDALLRRYCDVQVRGAVSVPALLSSVTAAPAAELGLCASILCSMLAAWMCLHRVDCGLCCFRCVYACTQVNMRLVMLDFTSALVAAAGSEELQQQVRPSAS